MLCNLEQTNEAKSDKGNERKKETKQAKVLSELKKDSDTVKLFVVIRDKRCDKHKKIFLFVFKMTKQTVCELANTKIQKTINRKKLFPISNGNAYIYILIYKYFYCASCLCL